jgi:hypothetical protein
MKKPKEQRLSPKRRMREIIEPPDPTEYSWTDPALALEAVHRELAAILTELRDLTANYDTFGQSIATMQREVRETLKIVSNLKPRT